MKYLFLLLFVGSCSSKKEAPTNDINLADELSIEFEQAMQRGRLNMEAGRLDSAMYWSGYMEATIRERARLLKNN